MIGADVMLALPEILMAIVAMALLILGTFLPANGARLVTWIALLALALAFVIVAWETPARTTAFEGLFIADQFGRFMKLLVLLGSGLALAMSAGYVEREQMARYEFPVLFLFATLGMMLMISANDLIALYLGLEMQSLALYVVAAFRRETVRSTEAGLKYFVLGALSSGMLLYGASLVYGFAGTTQFEELATVLAGETVSSGAIVGLVFIAAGIAFKISAVPFHMWTPDVYEGAPTPVTAFFAAAPKIAAMALFARVLLGPFGGLAEEWRQIVLVISVGSMLLGAFAAINQTNIKRLMAYSSIGNVGYALVGLAAGTEQGLRGVLIYMAIYLFMTLGTFACILAMKQKGRMVEQIADLAGLSRTNPMLALALALFMFSMAGIPPLAGFFAKYFVFLAAIEAQLYVLAVIGVLSSVVSAFYYWRIVRVMYFEDAVEGLDRPLEPGVAAVLAVSTAVITLFILAPGVILGGARIAAQSLFPA
ncbi:MAG TPA: NADH-quinone oxidoreductase subunit NuoN [Alphaproteobacteria bacterium]|nr:NADH-quinone oxidoreductase subunit NuoN [Alphaproteobacteria bacterium]